MTTKAQEIAEIIERLEGDYDVSIEVTGGGRGWTATTDSDLSIKATSKWDVLQMLEVELEKAAEGDDSGEEIEGCSDECQSSQSVFCQCACDGQNHGIAGSVKSDTIVVIGNKTCKCGCGEITKRTFVPGHDARYHGLVGLIQWGRENGLIHSPRFDGDMGPADLSEVRKAKAASLRKAARERRAVKRAGEAAVAEAMIAGIKANARPSAKQVKATAKVQAETDAALSEQLPF